MSTARVAIIGAGYAGMAAAVTLAEQAVPATVFESGPVPGGRARRVRIRGTTFDNGQHLLVGAYVELFRLMRTVGVAENAVLRRPLELCYARDLFSLHVPNLPGSLGLLTGLLRAHGVSISERLGAMRFMLAMRRKGFRVTPDCSVSQLLARHGQAGAIGKFLWGALCVSALNTPPAEASANLFLAVLRDTLNGPPGATDLVFARTDLSSLFPEPAARYIAARGGALHLETPVRGIVRTAGGLAIGEQVFSHVILACGPHQLGAFADTVGPLPHYAYQPIYTCYLQYPETVRLPRPMLGLDGGSVQWVFDRGRINGEAGRIACVISAEGAHRKMDHEHLAARCHGELRDAFSLPAPLSAQIIAEKRATIACAPDLPRIGPDTATPGLLLAGDYTDSDYPPTLEAAARSGVRAGRMVLDRLS